MIAENKPHGTRETSAADSGEEEAFFLRMLDNGDAEETNHIDPSVVHNVEEEKNNLEDRK